MAQRALIFDLDGTLWRGHEWYSSVLSEVTVLDKTVAMQGLATGKNVFQLARNAGLSKEGFIRACHAHFNRLTLYDGVLSSLQQLADSGCELGIVTSLSERLARPALERCGLEPFFRAKEFAARKPSPRALIAAIATLGQQAGPRHYYIGDTAQDASCARRGRVSFAWARYGYGNLTPDEYDLVLEKFTDVIKLLE